MLIYFLSFLFVLFTKADGVRSIRFFYFVFSRRRSSGNDRTKMRKREKYLEHALTKIDMKEERNGKGGERDRERSCPIRKEYPAPSPEETSVLLAD